MEIKNGSWWKARSLNYLFLKVINIETEMCFIVDILNGTAEKSPFDKENLSKIFSLVNETQKDEIEEAEKILKENDFN